MSGCKSLATPGSVRRARRLSRVLILSLGLGVAGVAAAEGSGQASQKARVDTFVTLSGLPRGWVASVKPDIVVAIRDRDALGDRNPGDRVRLQGEVIDDDAADRLGYRSMRSVVEVNCETRRDRVVEMEVFSDHGLKGTSQGRTLPGGWVQPSEDAYMADVIRVVCRATPRRTGTQVARQDAPEPAVSEPARKPTLTPKPPAPAPQVAAPPTPPVKAAPPPAAPPPPSPSPSPDGPIATAVMHTPRETQPAAAPVAPRAEAPAVEPPPQKPQTIPQAAPPPAPPAARPETKPEPKPRPAPPKPPTASGGPVTAQVGALDSEADARRALKALSGLMAGAMTPQVQTVKVGERTFYRAVIGGFASRAEANAFCAAVARKGGDCLVR